MDIVDEEEFLINNLKYIVQPSESIKNYFWHKTFLKALHYINVVMELAVATFLIYSAFSNSGSSAVSAIQVNSSTHSTNDGCAPHNCGGGKGLV